MIDTLQRYYQQLKLVRYALPVGSGEMHTGPHLPFFFPLEQDCCCLELHDSRVLTADFPRLSDKNGDALQERITKTLSNPAAGLSPPAGSHSADQPTHNSHIVPTSQDC